MIEYILFSYVVMFIFLACTYKDHKETHGLISDIKLWILSPIMLPLMVIVKFLS